MKKTEELTAFLKKRRLISAFDRNANLKFLRAYNSSDCDVFHSIVDAFSWVLSKEGFSFWSPLSDEFDKEVLNGNS